MKMLFLGLLLFGLQGLANGQICGTPAEVNSNYLSQLRTAAVTNDCFLDPSVRIDVNVKYHIVRDDLGNGGVGVSTLRRMTQRLNADLNPHNIFINNPVDLNNQSNVLNNLGFDYINSTRFYDLGSDLTELNALAQTNSDPNVIDIYVVNSIDGPAVGKAGGILSKVLAIDADHAYSHVLSHELGHCFNLFHTFRGSGYEQTATSCPERTYPAPQYVETIDCENCGDYVCDTPPHDQAPWNITSPVLLQNLMTVFSNTNQFTPGQAMRMREAFATSSLLQNTVTNLCPQLDGPDEVCDTPDGTYMLTNGISATWQVSSNLQVVSQTPTSITVRHMPSTPGGSGYVRTTTSSGIVVQKDLQVGTTKPTGFISVVIESNKIRVHVVPVPGATSYEWHVNSLHHTGNGLNSDDVVLTTDINSSVQNYDIGVKAVGPCGVSWMYYETHANPWYQASENRYGFAPNPASETLTILRSASDNEKNRTANSLSRDVYELHDFTGNRVLKGKLSNETAIDIRGLKSGRYILTIILENGDQEKHHIIVE